MKRVICNYCRTETAGEGIYSAAPTGWISVSFRGQYDERHTDLDFCQPSCATAYIEALAVEDVEKKQELVRA